MSKRISILIVIVILALSTLACSFSGINVSINTDSVRGSGNIDSETREVSGVTAVSLSSIGDLTIRLGEEESLLVEAEDNLIPYITTEVRSGTLTIGTQNGTGINPTKPVRYILTVTEELESLSVSGLGSINAPDLETERLNLSVSGSGDIDLDGLMADRLNVQISGLGSISVDSGAVDYQEIEISGSGQYEGEDVECREADVAIGGLGSATIWVTEQLNARISGSGDIEYYGNPRIQQDVSGLGSLRSLGER